MSIFQKWLNGQASACDLACGQTILNTLHNTFPPTAEQRTALQLILTNNRDEQSWAMMLAFNLGQIVGAHQLRKQQRTRKGGITA